MKNKFLPNITDFPGPRLWGYSLEIEEEFQERGEFKICHLHINLTKILMADTVKIIDTEILYENWSTLKRINFDFRMRDGSWQTQKREVFDRGNGATILLYNKEQKTVILTRQFRLPSFINGNKSGLLIEACAGMLEKENPEEGIKREALEETGYKVTAVQKIFEAYMSPGAVTENLHFFVAEYSESMKALEGGGNENEQEDIEVLEINIHKAMEMIKSGEIRDAKTIMLLQYIKLYQIL